MEEEWLPVEGYDGDYIVSNFGEVKSFKRYKDGRILKPGNDGGGYRYVILCKNGKTHIHRIHVLVGEAFIGLRTGELTYDHIDINRLNNRVDNIRLATKSQQTVNQNICKNNKTGYKNICIYNDKRADNTYTYYRIQIKRNKKMVVDKLYSIKKLTLEEVVKIRDEELAKLGENIGV